MDDIKDAVSKSWFAVFDNPELHGYDYEPMQIIEKLRDEWIENNPTRSGAWIYCISETGLKHVHMILEDTKAMRWTAIKKSYAIGMHFNPTKGTKEQAEDYINKRGKWEEKGEQVICSVRHGEIKANRGNRRDLETIEELIALGKTPSEIMDMSFSYRRYDKMIRGAYFSKRNRETPFIRDVKVVWHVGASGSGKSYCAKQLIDDHGEDYIYFVTDYENGFLDKYCGEPVLFLDEYRGQFRFSTLLTMLQGYKTQVHCRYENAVQLWNEVHITSVKAPEMVYESLIESYEERQIDTFEQLRRRISEMVYHWKDADGYHQYSVPMTEYKNYNHLLDMVKNFKSPFDGEETTK